MMTINFALSTHNTQSAPLSLLQLNHHAFLLACPLTKIGDAVLTYMCEYEGSKMPARACTPTH